VSAVERVRSIFRGLERTEEERVTGLLFSFMVKFEARGRVLGVPAV